MKTNHSKWVWWLLLTMLMSALLCLAPHISFFFAFSDPVYFADQDDILYLSLMKWPFNGRPFGDPFVDPSLGLPTAFSPFLFVDFAKLTTWLNLDLSSTPILMRLIGGLWFGFAIFVFLRRMLPHRSSLCHSTLSLVCLCSVGFLSGRPLWDNLSLIPQIVHATSDLPKPDALHHFRFVSPLLNFPLLLLFVSEFFSKELTSKKVIRCGALLGLLFHTYFFFWTAAIGGIVIWASMGYLRQYRLPYQRIGIVLFIGTTLGIPSLGKNIILKREHTESLDRMARGAVVEPISLRTAYLNNKWAFAKIGLGIAMAAVSKSSVPGILLSMTLAGYLLQNSAIITKLEFENWHWSIIHSSFGFFLVLWWLQTWFRNRCLQTLAIASIAIGAIWRFQEPLVHPSSLNLKDQWDHLQTEVLQNLPTPCLFAGDTIANLAHLFTPCSLLYNSPYSSHGSFLTNEQVHARFSMNAMMNHLPMDTDTSRFAALGPIRPEWQPSLVKARRNYYTQAPATHLFMDRHVFVLNQKKPPGTWENFRSLGALTIWKRL